MPDERENSHWKDVARECRCRIIAPLHQCGAYTHYHNPKYGGKVICLPRGAPVGDDWQLTEAQEKALLGDGWVEEREGEGEVEEGQIPSGQLSTDALG